MEAIEPLKAENSDAVFGGDGLRGPKKLPRISKFCSIHLTRSKRFSSRTFDCAVSGYFFSTGSTGLVFFFQAFHSSLLMTPS